MQLEGKQVVLLSGSGGIGLATASLAKQAGASVTNEFMTGEVLHIDGGGRLV